MSTDNIEIIRSALQQAAVHSPDELTRDACELAMREPGMATFLIVSQTVSCSYAPKLRRLIMDHWMGRDLNQKWWLQ